MVIDKEFEQKLIDDNFFEPETRNDFVVDEKRKKLWAVELDLLRKFIEVCEKYKLRYFVDAGTLLGTIRHKGFIPWDDDIDVVMPREDYDVFLQETKADFQFPYILQSPYSENDYHRTHAQIRNVTTTAVLKNELGRYSFNQGAFLDVFPLDKAPYNRLKYSHYMNVIKRYNFFRRLKYGIFNPKKKLLKILSNLVSGLIPKKIVSVKRYEDFCGKYKYLKNGRIDKFVFREGIKKKVYNFEANWYDDYSIKEFEMLKVQVPKDYDKVLKSYYGINYMTPVNCDTTHGDLYFDCDISFDEYMKIWREKDENKKKY